MNKPHPFTAFYVETALLILIVAAMLAALAGVFVSASVQSKRAAQLTEAVLLAQNAAEAASAAKRPGDLTVLLDEGGNVTQTGENQILARYDGFGKPNAAGSLSLVIDWQEKDFLAHVTISVFGTRETPLYVLETAVYTKEAGA